MAPFPQRSRPGLLIQAACGGLHPAPASRVREAYSFSHLLRRLLRHTEIRDPELIRSRRRTPPIDEIRRPLGRCLRPRGDHPRPSAARATQPHRAHHTLDGAAGNAVPFASQLLPHFAWPIDLVIRVPDALNGGAEFLIV